MEKMDQDVFLNLLDYFRENIDRIMDYSVVSQPGIRPVGIDSGNVGMKGNVVLGYSGNDTITLTLKMRPAVARPHTEDLNSKEE